MRYAILLLEEQKIQGTGVFEVPGGNAAEGAVAPEQVHPSWSTYGAPGILIKHITAEISPSQNNAILGKNRLLAFNKSERSFGKNK